MTINIRKAKLKDVEQIHGLVNYYAEKRAMLPRALNQIYENIQGYYVAVEGSKVVGCCALGITWGDMAEVKSLAVSEKCQKKGIGQKLVKLCIREAKNLGVKKVFALTYVPGFFKKLGFTEIDKEKLPHKIWTECINCRFFPNCNEIALLKNL
jgi:amino-acid N-acetyltransferase